MQNPVPQNPKLAAHYQFDPKNPYFRKGMPNEIFEKIFEGVKQKAIGFLCMLDQSHAELYKTNAPKIFPLMEEGCFKELIRDWMAGCENLQTPFAEGMMKAAVVRTSAYYKFLLERELYKEELDKINVDKPLMLIGLPRSGTTFSHMVMNCDPKAHGIGMYEHIVPGSKTMTNEGRLAFAEKLLNPINGDQSEFNKVHAMKDLTKAEEELFFFEMLGHSLIYPSLLSRLEEYRYNVFERNFDWLYHDLIYEMKMHCMEHPMKEGDHLCMKCISHFASPYPLFNIMGDELKARFVWIHRDPIGELKSYITGLFYMHGNYPNDLGLDDHVWFNKHAIEMIMLALKNAIKARDDWIAENPEHSKQIIDVGFKQMTRDPTGIAKKICDFFGMEYNEEFEKRIKDSVENGHPQKNEGHMDTSEQAIKFTSEEIKEKFAFYYERFGEYLN